MLELEAAERADAAPAQGRLRVLWVVHPDFAAARHHGAVLRYYNYARELVRRGHEVYFLVDLKGGDRAGTADQLDALRRDGTISGHFQTRYAPPRLRRRIAGWLGYPAAGNHLLRREQAAVTAQIRDVVQRESIDLCIFSDRDLVFAAPETSRHVATVIDWADCFTLYMVRLLAEHVRRGPRAPLPRFVRYLAEAVLFEGYYSRRVDANVVVSPVDRRWMDGLNGRPAANHVLLNGVHAAPASAAAKVKGRIVFTGNMDFPPNRQAALWFIDHVLPIVVARRPDVRFVAAGANPGPELRARAGAHVEVTGFVEDMAAEIACSELYVAPLVSGAGFKNKVVEAISSGTFVVGTPMAVEFLPDEARRHLVVVRGAPEMAAAVLDFLDAPARFDERLRALRAMVAGELNWGSRAEALVALARGCAAARG